MPRSILSALGVAALLRSHEVRAALPMDLGAEPEVVGPRGRQATFTVVGADGTYVLRFPSDARALAGLRVEERVTEGLRDRVSLRIPYTRVFELGSGIPAFALHEMVPGSDWFELGVRALPAEPGARLARDLARFMHETHSVPLETAGEWLGLETSEPCWRAALAAREGKPCWFRGEKLGEIRRRLAAALPEDLRGLVTDTADRHERLTVSSDDLVFGHGDLHGGNLAFAEDEAGPRLEGVFDFGGACILDYHHDFARLNLIYDELQDRVREEYARLSLGRPVNRDRVETYARAFVFYLLAEHVGDDGLVSPDRAAGFEHLVRLLRDHVAYDASRARVGS